MSFGMCVGWRETATVKIGGHRLEDIPLHIRIIGVLPTLRNSFNGDMAQKDDESQAILYDSILRADEIIEPFTREVQRSILLHRKLASQSRPSRTISHKHSACLVLMS